jgi:hypothetical protein
MSTTNLSDKSRRLIRRRHAAERGDTSVSTLRRLEAAGKLKPIRLRRNGHVYYDLEQFLALISGGQDDAR